MAPANTGLQQVVKLEERLTLLAWLNDRFGYRSNRELLADMKQAAEGFDATGRSFVYYRLIALGDKLQVPPDDLARYDDNIRSHLAAMNARRPEPITLRYFQHLAAHARAHGGDVSVDLGIVGDHAGERVGVDAHPVQRARHHDGEHDEPAGVVLFPGWNG